MNVASEQELLRKYADILQLDHPHRGADGYPWFEHDDGWHDIVNAGLHVIQSHARNAREGDPASLPAVKIIQVKEKFGALRIYARENDEFVAGVISLMEFLSRQTCGICGAKAGSVRRRNWVRTLCNEHAVENGYSVSQPGA